MGDKKLLENDKGVDKSRMGFGTWRPDWLQYFNSMKWYLTALSLTSLTQAITVSGVTAVNLQSLETEFGLTSKETGLIMTGNDISALFLVTAVSFFGTKASKPKWMGIGSIITGLGILMFALPKLMIGKREVFGVGRDGMKSALCMVGSDNSTTLHPEQCNGGDSKQTLAHMAVFMISQLLMGIGTCPLYTLGPTYLDENVAPRAAPIYLGIWFCCTMLGPPIGMIIGGMFLKIYTDIDAPKNIGLKDPRWVGAWWLGYVSFFGLFLIVGFFLFLFPKQLKSKQTMKREKSIKLGQLPAESKMNYTFKGYLQSMLSLCKNKVFMLTVLGVTIKLLYTIGMVTFLIKILILKFGIEPSKAGQTLGIILIPSLILGVMMGAGLLRCIKLEMAAKTAALICFIVCFVNSSSSFMFLIPGCRNTNLAGVITPYYNQTSTTGSIISQCNSKCNCQESIYLPLCGSDGKTYHSPCHAGCTTLVLIKGKKPTTVFGNCSCFPENIKFQQSNLNQNSSMIQQQPPLNMVTQQMNISKEEIIRSSFFNEAVIGKCDRNCKNFLLFIGLTIVYVFFSFLSSTPHKIMLLRSVADNQRAFALGTQFVIMRGISFLPGPLLMGAILDGSCISWGYDKCGKKTSCHDYNIEQMSWTLSWFGFATSVIGAICYFFAWYWYPVGGEKVSMNNLLANDEDEN